MRKPAVDTVVFDLGGVLVEWDPRRLFRTVFADEAAMEHFLAHVCTPEWNHQMDAGRPRAEAEAELVAAHPRWAEQIRTYNARWPEMLGEPIAGSVAVLDELAAAGHRLLALTNWSAETFPVALARYGCLARFEGIVVSGDEGVAKPDPALYRTLLDRYGVDPVRSVFVDDRPANVVTARQLGLVGLVFTDPATLRADLVALGLLPERPTGAAGRPP